MGIAPSKGALALNPLVMTQAGQKSNLLKSKEKAVAEVRKGAQSTIARALREGSAQALEKK
jgi:hypothetical protein